MKKLGLIITIITIAVLAGCASSGSSAPAELPPIPEGAQRIALENGAYAIFRFDLPEGMTWGNYNKLTAEYMIDETNLKKRIRNENNVRLMGNYAETTFVTTDGNMWANLADETGLNGPYIMDNTSRTFASMGAVADQWFTVTYNITGSAGHAQYKRTNVPAAGATGPFFFGIGISAHEPGRRSSIVQFVRNVTLHHSTNPELNVVSEGSGFDQPSFASFYPIMSRREGGN
ncbi:MAG: hypothetical protein FWB86_03640 [Treponema sp.]|nr:hypothetical protein [Treponema sp.]MCL2250425.1 hypothetical protein [Treponema sp.]